MSSAFSKADDNSVAVAHGKRISVDGELEEEEGGGGEETTTGNTLVTSHVYIKPPHSTRVLDRDTVLRRIRMRKRMNRLQASVQSLFGSPPGAASAAIKKSEKASVAGNAKRWIDDAFAAP